MTANLKVQTHPTITVDQIGAVLSVFCPKKQNVFFLSQPGIGKTVAISKWAKDQGAELIVEVASLLDRLDLAGLPHLVQYEALAGVTQVTKFAPNSKMAQLSKEHNPNGGPVVVYLNEFNAAPDSVYPVLYRLLNERAIGDLHIRDNVVFAADGNPAQSQSAGRVIQEALKRRFAMFEVETSYPVWQAWANDNGVDGRVVAFLSRNAGCLNDFDPTKRHRLTYACPASWEKLSFVLEEILKEQHETLRRAMIAAVVGAEAGEQFNGYIGNLHRMPNIEAMLADPEKCELPTAPDVISLTVGCIYNMVVEDQKLIKPATMIAMRLLETAAEFGIYMFRVMAQNKALWKKVSQSETFTKKAMPLITGKPGLMDAIFKATREK